MTPLLEVNQVRKQYGATVALEGVSFQVFAGEIFGLLGPNGAGKTTLLSILSCLLEATSGEVRLLGQPASAGQPRGAPADRHRAAGAGASTRS